MITVMYYRSLLAALLPLLIWQTFLYTPPVILIPVLQYILIHDISIKIE